jgi:hypothetical protein
MIAVLGKSVYLLYDMLCYHSLLCLLLLLEVNDLTLPLLHILIKISEFSHRSSHTDKLHSLIDLMSLELCELKINIFELLPKLLKYEFPLFDI